MLSVDAPLITDWIQAIGTFAGAVVVVAGLVFSGRQLVMLRRQLEHQEQQQRRDAEQRHADALVTRAQLDLTLMTAMLDLDRLFLAKPHLYPYFNAPGTPPPTDDEPVRAEVLACAELIIDYADMIARQRRMRQIPRADLDAWRELLSSYRSESPAISEIFPLFERGCRAGTGWLLGIVEGDYPDEPAPESAVM
jgi:hypothetical protein